MTLVKVVASSDGKTKREINLDGFEDLLRKYEKVICCDVCDKPVRKGSFYMGMFCSGHKKCVEKGDNQVFEDAKENLALGLMIEDEDDHFEDDEEEPGFDDDD